jgi:hypothetical protein
LDEAGDEGGFVADAVDHWVVLLTDWN